VQSREKGHVLMLNPTRGVQTTVEDPAPLLYLSSTMGMVLLGATIVGAIWKGGWPQNLGRAD
jgi:hypothetical protein